MRTRRPLPRPLERFRNSVALALFLLLTMPLFRETADAQPPENAATARQTLAYGGSTRREAALAVARAAAWLEALRQAAENLNHSAAQYAAVSPLRRKALAAAAHRPAVSVSPAKVPLSSAGDVTVAVSLFTPARTLDSRLREALRYPDMLTLREEALRQVEAAAREGVELSASVDDARPGVGADETFNQRIERIGNKLNALWIFEEVLARWRGAWREPARVLRLLTRAVALDGENALLWCVLGEVQLQLDRPRHALESLNKALALNSELPRALYARALGHLRLGRHALAEADLTSALRFDPHMPEWLQARGAARMLRKEHASMCDDFEQACARGLCDGLAAARKQGLCAAGETP